jgi:biopolymer transport protein ExbB/TolQ
VQINLWEIWKSMGLPVRCVVILLTFQAIACVAVVFDRVLLLTQSSKRSRLFAGAVQPAMEAGAYQTVLSEAQNHLTSHLATFLDLGLRTFITRVNAGDEFPRAAELTRRALERKGDAISRELNRGMNILASTGSTAPFVGLLGTVLGIINAFKMIAATGSGGLGSIGGSIAEALIVTGYGLMVAIPSVLVFNGLSAMIASYEAGLINAGSELVDRLETTVVNQPPAAAREAAPASAAPRSGRPMPSPGVR